MRWSLLFHLLLCALLSVQRPSVLLRDGRWLQPASALNSQSPISEQLVEEEELHAIRSVARPRLKALAGTHPPKRPERGARVMKGGLPERCCDAAEAHWREALLPRRGPLDDEPPPRA